jgi:photoprotection regulator FRP-like protein
MTNSPQPAFQTERPQMRDLHWSRKEKEIAHKAFQQALDSEFETIAQKVKKMAEKIELPDGLWDLEEFLTKSRQGIGRKYDYRYSVLPMVFGILIREGRLREDDLQGLGEDKLHYIRGYAQR